MIASCQADVDDFATKRTDLLAPMHFIARLGFKNVLSCCFILAAFFCLRILLLGSKTKGKLLAGH